MVDNLMLRRSHRQTRSAMVAKRFQGVPVEPVLGSPRFPCLMETRGADVVVLGTTSLQRGDLCRVGGAPAVAGHVLLDLLAPLREVAAEVVADAGDLGGAMLHRLALDADGSRELVAERRLVQEAGCPGMGVERPPVPASPARRGPRPRSASRRSLASRSPPTSSGPAGRTPTSTTSRACARSPRTAACSSGPTPTSPGEHSPCPMIPPELSRPSCVWFLTAHPLSRRRETARWRAASWRSTTHDERPP
jgi:hypothetical protein